ncbi:MAG: Fic/DOC family protein [Bacteroidetes bacterium]|nr:MAG: Fic/DOC family protein [Bacteroidota bacterium]
MNKVLIYKTKDKHSQVEVRFDQDTVWLNLNQIAELFDRDKSVISRHLGNIFKEKELDRKSTVAKNATVQMEAGREVGREIEYFNLDAIISVGYRVNSKRGTQFRQWATQRLKEYLIQGYSVNQKRLKQVSENLHMLEQTVKQIQQTGSSENLKLNEAKGLLDILGNYTRTLLTLSRYDSDSLETDKLSKDITYEIKHPEAREAIVQLRSELKKRKESSDLFGNEKDESFKGILGNIVQTFGGEYLYHSIEEQAAHLLYFIIKNHPFSDGNKRIGAFLFIWFLERNKHRLKKSGEPKINDNGLTALALLVAQSDPAHKELMIKLVINLIVDV